MVHSLVYRNTCSKVHRCSKVLLKVFHSKPGHNIQITVHHLSNILTRSKFNSCMLKNSGEPLCLLLSLNKKDRNRDLHRNRNRSRSNSNTNLLNHNHPRRNKKSNNLHHSKC